MGSTHRGRSHGAQRQAAATALALRVLPVTPERWPDLETFCGPSGMYANCWCVWWRRTSGEFDEGIRDHGAGNRALLERLTLDGAVPGLLAYEDEAPVGWVSVAPRREFGRVLRSPRLKPEPTGPPDPADPADGPVYAIVCFWVPREHRGRGIGRALLDGAVEHARTSGARAVEAYPIDTENAQAQASHLFTGTLSMFAEAGFVEVRRRRGRPTVSLDLR